MNKKICSILNLVLFSMALMLQATQCNAGRLKLTCAEADSFLPEQQRIFMGAFTEFLMQNILINPMVMDVVKSIEEDIEIELVYNSFGDVIAKYKNDFPKTGGASMVEVRRIIIGAHPSEFEKPLTTSRKQEIIGTIVFELFNIKKMLENEKKGIKWPDPMDYREEKPFINDVMRQEHQIFDDGQLLKAYELGHSKYGWGTKDVAMCKKYRHIDAFMLCDSHADIYRQQFNSRKKLLQEIESIFNSLNDQISKVMQNINATILDKRKQLQHIYDMGKQIIDRKYPSSKTDNRIYRDKIIILLGEFENRIEQELRKLDAQENPTTSTNSNIDNNHNILGIGILGYIFSLCNIL